VAETHILASGHRFSMGMLVKARKTLAFHSDGLIAVTATLITTSFGSGSGFGPGPTSNGFLVGAVIHAALLSVIDDMLAY